MRVLHLDSGQQLRGGQLQVLRLVQGVGGTLLCPAASPLFARAEAAGLDVHPLHFLAAARAAARADLVHAHDAHSHTLAALVSFRPIVVARRVAFPIHSRWKYRRAAHFIAVSEYVKSILLARGIPDRKVSVVYDGVPLRDPAPAGACVAILRSDDPLKANQLALDACTLARIEPRVSPNLDSLLNDALCLLYLTYSEGLGSAALAAMSAGVPVVASRAGGLPEIITHGEDGLLVSNNTAEIAQALRFLTENRALARLMGTRARQKIAARFSLDLMIENTQRVYQQVRP